MSVDAVVADSNVLIVLLKGDAALTKLLRGASIHISFMTEVELQAWPQASDADLIVIREMLAQCIIVNSTAAVKSATILLRRSTKAKIADCFVAGTAMALGLPLLTRDAGFKKLEQLVEVQFV